MLEGIEVEEPIFLHLTHLQLLVYHVTSYLHRLDDVNLHTSTCLPFILSPIMSFAMNEEILHEACITTVQNEMTQSPSILDVAAWLDA